MSAKSDKRGEKWMGGKWMGGICIWPIKSYNLRILNKKGEKKRKKTVEEIKIGGGEEIRKNQLRQ